MLTSILNFQKCQTTEKRQAIGEKTNTIYKIGDKVKIRVVDANKILRKIDFELV